MIEWMSMEEWDTIWTAFHKRTNLDMQDQLQVIISLEMLISLLKAEPTFDPPGMGDPPGPLAVWFGVCNQVPILLSWQVDRDLAVFRLPVDKEKEHFQWESLHNLEELPKEIFEKISGLTYYRTKEKNFALFDERESQSDALYYASTLEDAESLSRQLKTLGCKSVLWVKQLT